MILNRKWLPKSACYNLLLAARCVIRYYAMLIAASFLGDFLHSVAQQHWNGAALVYVMYGVSQLKPSPVWGVSALNDIG